MALQSTTAIATITLQQASSQVVFSGIPATYRDLILITNARAATATSFFRMRFNSDTGLNYSHVMMLGFEPSNTQSSASTENAFDLDYFGNAVTTQDNVHNVTIMEYAQTDKHKTSLVRNKFHSSSGGLRVSAMAVRYASMSAITTVSIFLNSGSIASGSTFSLYGRIA